MIQGLGSLLSERGDGAEKRGGARRASGEDSEARETEAAAPGIRGLSIPRPPRGSDALQLLDGFRHRPPFNVLHGVKVNPTLAPHREDGNDMGMVELSGRLSLVLKTLELARIEDGGEG